MNPNSVAVQRRAARLALWQIHGLAAWLATPFLVVAALTGLIYLPTPQIERWQTPATGAAPAAQPLPLTQQVQAAVSAAEALAPGLRLKSVQVPADPADLLRAEFQPPAAAGAQHHGEADGLTLFIDPANARLLGQQRDSERYGSWAMRLHSRLLGGEGWRWMVEWAATCLLVMLLSGLALAAPALRARGLRRWHALTGLSLLLLSLAIVLTGLTWSRFAGAQVRELRDWAGQGSPRPPADLRSSAGGEPLDWDAVAAIGRAQMPGLRLQLVAPRTAEGVWRLSSPERQAPRQRVELVLDAYSGAVLWRSGWAELPAFAKATAVGIPFHRGELGVWNQALLLLFGLGVLGSCWTGGVLAWGRWRAAGLNGPARSAWAALRWRWPLLGAGLLLSLLLPLLAVFLVLMLALQRLPRRPPAQGA